MPVSIAPSAHRHFKRATGEDERAENPAPVFGRNPQLSLHPRASHRDAHPVEECDHRQRRKQRADGVALAAASGLRGLLFSVQSLDDLARFGCIGSAALLLIEPREQNVRAAMTGRS